MWNKKVPNNQEQAVEGGSIALQAEQINDVTINNGVLITEIIPICNQLFDMNFPRLRDEAAKVALENVHNFSIALQANLNQNIENILLEKLADPDIQFCLNQSIQLAARFGEKAHPDLLIKLINTKMLESTDDFNNLICNQAIEIVPKLVSKHIDFIVFIYLLDTFLPSYEKEDDWNNDLKVEFFLGNINEIIEKLILPFSQYERVDLKEAKYLESIGILIHNNNHFAYRAIDKHTHHYSAMGIKEEDILNVILENSALTYKKLIDNYDNLFRGHYFGISAIGEQIAISTLKNYGLYELYRSYI
ncbi:hypothetical protein B9T34_14035 [Acinetobacter sp. ANC 3813]|nr:hypothetical protein B9T34_14035 [Acinetobacter sp. ANC 3813]